MILYKVIKFDFWLLCYVSNLYNLFDKWIILRFLGLVIWSVKNCVFCSYKTCMRLYIIHFIQSTCYNYYFLHLFGGNINHEALSTHLSGCQKQLSIARNRFALHCVDILSIDHRAKIYSWMMESMDILSSIKRQNALGQQSKAAQKQIQETGESLRTTYIHMKQQLPHCVTYFSNIIKESFLHQHFRWIYYQYQTLVFSFLYNGALSWNFCNS